MTVLHFCPVDKVGPRKPLNSEIGFTTTKIYILTIQISPVKNVPRDTILPFSRWPPSAYFTVLGGIIVMKILNRMRCFVDNFRLI